MTALEIIDFVENALTQQGVKSVSLYTDACMYRYSGLKCAVGHLIPDEMYDANMEGETVAWLLARHKELKEVLLPTDLSEHDGIRLLGELQRIHDGLKVHKWKQEFDALRQTYDK